MKPNDHFSFLSNNQVSQDMSGLARYYLPIVGKDAVALYLYLVSFWDNGAQQRLFSHILNHLDFGMEVLERSLERLSAIGLLELFQTETGFFIRLYPTLSAEDFFAHHVYSSLLEKKIGQAAVDKLRPEIPAGQKISPSFSQIYGMDDVSPTRTSRQNDFDLTHFKQRMAQDGLRFADEKTDLLDLFAIAEQKKWTWYETYVLARETAVSHVISTKRMQQKIQQKPISGDFSQQEQSIIREAKSKQPLLFLAEIKKTRQAAITRSERKLIQDLAEMGLLDEVINIILLLTFNKVDSANLNEKYALKVANDFSYQKVTSAEEAVLKIRERNQQTNSRPAQVSPASAKSNVPNWSQPDYKNETSLEKQAELEEQKRRLLARLEEGGD